MPTPLTQFEQPKGVVSELEALAQIARMPGEAKTHIREIDLLKERSIRYAARAEVAPAQQLRALERLCATDVPNVVAAWLQLPPEAVLDDGRPADEVLVGQLARLHEAAAQYEHDSLQSARDDMHIESIYLHDKYGSAS